jgi:hypothetical protein
LTWGIIWCLSPVFTVTLIILVIGPDVPCVSVELKLKMPVQIWSHAFQVIMQSMYLLIPLKWSIICFLSPDFAVTVSTLVIDPDVLFISKIQVKIHLQIWSYAFQVRFGVLLHRIRSKVDDSALNMDYFKKNKSCSEWWKNSYQFKWIDSYFLGNDEYSGGRGRYPIGHRFSIFQD